MPSMVKAQSFSMSDSVFATVDATGNVLDTVKVPSGSAGVTLKWRVVASTFPADWLTATAFGICDNVECRNNTGSTYIWNAATNSGTTFTSAVYSAGYGDFHLSLDLTGVSCGMHSVTINLSDPSTLTSQNVTFVINKDCPASVPTISNTDNILLYPNPAVNELNVVYDASADIKNIAVYNIIGKVMSVYKVTANNSANLNIANIPSGIYFVRLINSGGETVVTKKFTKQ